MGPFAEEIKAHIYEIFMPTHILFICHPHRLHSFATCFPGHADVDISKAALLSLAIPS